MAGLDDINSSDPAGTESPTLGDDRIRALAAKIIEAFDIEHALAGPHTFLVGSAAQRPAAGYEGRFYILAAAGVAVELQYDTGVAWVSLTSNQAALGYASNLAAHIAASPIDHPDESVTQIKIAQGAILKKHFDSSGDMTTLEKLVDGSNADEHHTHGQLSAMTRAYFKSSGTWTCPEDVTYIFLAIVAGMGGGGAGGSFVDGNRKGGQGALGLPYLSLWYPVTPMQDYGIIIGVGGGGGIDSDGLAGGNTIFGANEIVKHGGHGGLKAVMASEECFVPAHGVTPGEGGCGNGYNGKDGLDGSILIEW